MHALPTFSLVYNIGKVVEHNILSSNVTMFTHILCRMAGHR